LTFVAKSTKLKRLYEHFLFNAFGLDLLKLFTVTVLGPVFLSTRTGRHLTLTILYLLFILKS